MDRLRGLDALRGLAALLVVLQHVCSTLEKSGHAMPGQIIDCVNLGKLGVTVFFLTSGYVVPFSLNSGPMRNFAISRAFRILPALWLSIMFVLATSPEITSLGQIAANGFMVARPLGFDLISNPYWTLEWELAFYCAAALIFSMGCLRDAHVLGSCALAALVAGFWFNEAIFFAFMFAGTLYRLGNGQSRCWLAGLLLGLAIFSVSQFTPDRAHWYIGVWAAIPLFLVFAKYENPPRLFVGLGAISYSIYLFHPTMLTLVNAFVPRTTEPTLYVIMVLSGSMAVAAMVYRYVERPAIQAGKTLRMAFRTREIAATC